MSILQTPSEKKVASARWAGSRPGFLLQSGIGPAAQQRRRRLSYLRSHLPCHQFPYNTYWHHLDSLGGHNFINCFIVCCSQSRIFLELYV
jgi:hypothetical protein